MRIKRLDLVGFKSFVLPTVIDFDSPIVGIVGPNGCGKSNLVDAIRWVMGEMSPKSLRGRAMEDVIFNGTDARPPQGMAEVSLTFSTEDGIVPSDYTAFTEITIARRLFRSGDSEYLINKVPCRLRDVIDLFLGTGVGHKAYSIIEQGKVDFVINAKPEERRLLLEEAAGVSKFKARKESALRKIEATEQNLARLKDILSEVTRQINSLDRQVKKAEKYKALKDELRELDLKLASLNYLEWTREVFELKTLLDEWGVKETSSMAQLATIETDLERGRLDLVEKDREYNSLQEKFFEANSRLQLLGAQEGFQKKEIAGLETFKESALREIEEIQSRLESLERDKEIHDSEMAGIEKESETALLVLGETEKSWQNIETERSNLIKTLNLLREEINKINSESTRLEGEKRLFDDRKTSLQGQISKIELESQEAFRLFEKQRSLLEEKKSLWAQAEERGRTLRLEAENLKKELFKHEEHQDALKQELNIRCEDLVFKRSRLKSLLELERNFEGYEEGVRSILKAKKENPENPKYAGVFGVVAEFIETSLQFELAVSAVLGERLQYVIIKSHEEGIAAIHYLKSQSTGRSSFIPLKVRKRTHVQSSFFGGEGIIGPLVNFVTIKKSYQSIADYLLEDVILVDSLDHALTLWKSDTSGTTWVTLDGDVVNPSGVVSGGAGNMGGKLLLEKKREIKELQTLTVELEQEIGLSEDTLSQLEGKISEISLTVETLSQQGHQEELKRTTLQNEAQHATSEYQRLEKELQKYTSAVTQLSQEAGKSDQFFMAYASQMDSFAQTLDQKNQDLQHKEGTLQQTERKAHDIQEKLVTLRVQAAATSERQNIAERDRERLAKSEEEFGQRMIQKQKEITEADEKSQILLQSLESASLEKISLKKTNDEVAVAQEVARVAYEALASTLKEKEERIRELRKEYDLAKSHTGDLRVTLSKLETEIHHLGQQVLERYSISLSDNATTPGELEPGVEFDREVAQQNLAELKEKLDRLGDVNLGALPEYQELKTREEFLGRQIGDLEASLEALKKAIHRINQTTKKRFEETFTAVNERFQTLFPRLFEGGHAELRLSQDQDLLNCGVELLVQPKGKKLSHISLLSGGEKAMSAVAFIFSIFLVKPSPFCILDEVDAPLDEVNTDRFHVLISEMAPRTQFILITHNRRTMEKTELLYGVTMQEPGISQLVSVRFQEGLKLAS